MMLLALWLLLAEVPIPMVSGAWWEYRESYTQRLHGVDSTEDDTTRFVLSGRPGRWFINQTGGFDPSPGPADVGASWLRLGPWTGEEALPLPLEPGRRGPVAEGGGAWTVELEEEITVPAGTFSALRCAFRTRSLESILWIVPGIGVVRETQGPPGEHPEIDRVLLRWGPHR
jgi:hypothetical protein